MQPGYHRRPGDRIVRPARIKGTRLRRVLGISALFSTGYGNVGSSIYYALGVTTLYALGAAPFALGAAGLIFILTVLTYAEAAVAVPEAGGVSSFARHGFNEMGSFLAGWTTLLSYVVTIAISAFSASGYLAIFFPILATSPYNVVVGVLIILSLMLLNVIGVQEAAIFSLIFAVIDLVTQVVLVIIGSIFLLNLPLLFEQIQWGVTPTWGNFLYGASVAMVAYTGINTIANMAEEARLPTKTVPRSYGLLIISVLVLFGGISIVALSAMPIECIDGVCTTELSTTYLADPVAGIAHKLPAPFSTFFEPMVGILASSILIIATNAGILGASRLSYSMGAHRQFPAFVYRLHGRFKTPYIAIIFFCAIAIIILLPGDIAQLADVYIFGAMLSFTIAHAAVIGMRFREPDLERPFKIPFNLKVRGKEVPITAVIGGSVTFIVWVVVLITHPFGRIVGFAWLLSGIALYVGYRRRSGLSLTETSKISESGTDRRISP